MHYTLFCISMQVLCGKKRKKVQYVGLFSLYITQIAKTRFKTNCIVKRKTPEDLRPQGQFSVWNYSSVLITSFPL